MDNHRRARAVCASDIVVSDMHRHLLILGGTIEARQLAARLAPRADWRLTVSLAGRTVAPLAQPVPVRRGGFGGSAGLARYLREASVSALIDATHPYAPTISAHAREAAEQTGTALLALRRSAWQAVSGDRWTEVESADGALRALGPQPRRVFLALGRQEIAPFAGAPQHRYLIRSIDPVDPPLEVPHAHYILSRGPFTEAQDMALLQTHAIEIIVAKNSGGTATYSKIAAARQLGIPVLLLRRPPATEGPQVNTIEKAIAWLDHEFPPGIERGV